MSLPRLSYSKIRTYLVCPRQYYYSYVEKLPFVPNAKMTFGSNVHKAIEEVTKRTDLKKTTSDELLRKLDTHWSSEGFSTPEEEEVYKAKAGILLEKFWHAEQSSQNKVLFVERSFQFPVGGAWISGRIDRIDERPDGTWEVVDYKTGQVPNTKTTFSAQFGPPGSPQSFDDGFQLLVYTMASKTVWDKWPDGTYYYLQDTSKHTQSFNPAQADAASAQIIRVATQIAAEEFTQCDTLATCRYCPYKARCQPPCIVKIAQRPSGLFPNGLD